MILLSMYLPRSISVFDQVVGSSLPTQLLRFLIFLKTSVSEQVVVLVRWLVLPAQPKSILDLFTTLSKRWECAPCFQSGVPLSPVIFPECSFYEGCTASLINFHLS